MAELCGQPRAMCEQHGWAVEFWLSHHLWSHPSRHHVHTSFSLSQVALGSQLKPLGPLASRVELDCS